MAMILVQCPLCQRVFPFSRGRLSQEMEAGGWCITTERLPFGSRKIYACRDCAGKQAAPALSMAAEVGWDV